MVDFSSKPNVATRFDRLQHLLRLIQYATEHQDHSDFMLPTISYALDLALDEVKALKVELGIPD